MRNKATQATPLPTLEMIEQRARELEQPLDIVHLLRQAALEDQGGEEPALDAPTDEDDLALEIAALDLSEDEQGRDASLDTSLEEPTAERSRERWLL